MNLKFDSTINLQIIDDRDFNVFFARDQRFFEIKIKQKNEINNLNKRKTRNKTNAKNEYDRNNCFDMWIEHREHVNRTQKYYKNQNI